MRDGDPVIYVVLSSPTYAGGQDVAHRAMARRTEMDGARRRGLEARGVERSGTESAIAIP
jgi:hypothetical protein